MNNQSTIISWNRKLHFLPRWTSFQPSVWAFIPCLLAKAHLCIREKQESWQSGWQRRLALLADCASLGICAVLPFMHFYTNKVSLVLALLQNRWYIRSLTRWLNLAVNLTHCNLKINIKMKGGIMHRWFAINVLFLHSCFELALPQWNSSQEQSS